MKEFIDNMSETEQEEFKNYKVIIIDGKKFIDIDFIVNFMERSLTYFRDYLETDPEDVNLRYKNMLKFSRHMDNNKAIIDHIDLEDKLNECEEILSKSEFISSNKDNIAKGVPL